MLWISHFPSTRGTWVFWPVSGIWVFKKPNPPAQTLGRTKKNPDPELTEPGYIGFWNFIRILGIWVFERPSTLL